METRQIRRIKHRHTRRIAVVIASIGALGVGIGLALPRSPTAPPLLLAVGVAGLAAAGVRVAASAPGRDLTRRIQTSSASAASAAVDWMRSKMVPVGLVQDEMLHDRFSERMSPYRVRGDRQKRGVHTLGNLAALARDRLNNTPHLWGLIALTFAYIALFALVVALTFVSP